MAISSTSRAPSSRRRSCLVGVVLVWAGLLCASASASTAAADSGTLTLKFGPGVHHWRNDPDHNNRSLLVGASWEFPSRWSVGGAFFRNSFHQPSQYLYMGKRWFPDSLPDAVYVKVTAGVLLGYKEPYNRKVPLNHARGIAPAVLPALGYQYKRTNVQLIPLGTAGLMMTFGVDL